VNISHRGNTGNGTYFVTSCTYQKISIFQTDRMAGLLMEVLEAYRPKGYLLHEFVIMPDHFHVLLTPLFTLEKALQFIKGGFSFRAGKAGHMGPIWEKSFHDRRVRDWEEYEAFCKYIHMNPVKRGLCSSPEMFRYGSAANQLVMDPPPQRLKPLSLGA
jgi:putative transposase